LKTDRAALLEKKGVAIIKGDICTFGLIEKLLDEYQITYVIHLAAYAGVRYSINHPDIYVEANIQGFLRLLEACKGRPDLPIVYASSSSVYGKNEKVPFALDDKTDMPTNMYGMSKKANELMAFVYHNIYKLPLVGLRFFTVYGPWGRPDMAYFLFADAICQEKPIDLYNMGDMRRDFTYIDDIVDGIVRSLEITKGNHLFNLGRGRTETLLDFVDILEKALGKKAKRNLLPMPVGEMVETSADIEESRRILGYNPQTGLEEGLLRFVDWYRSYKA
jgi:UDP-glucuronate 4-epimerase